jgi:hypothetical protein
LKMECFFLWVFQFFGKCSAFLWMDEKFH